ncbi:MAG TPA: hypothetical protein VJ717_13910 [Gemmatimonadaceae bacterium]|nr:hypothetical protein [Gemmatimonadaceae bacterium]
MNEDKLDELLQDASRKWRLPPEPRVNEIWAGIEASLDNRRPRQRLTPNWFTLLTAVAAALVFGVALGRFSASEPASLPGIAAPAAGVGEPYGRTTAELLGQTAVLLAALPGEGREGHADGHFSKQAGELLVTTRLLLDSPVAGDPRLRVLLEDLELVLAQVAQLPAAAPRNAAELEIINEALEERDVVPRIRVAVASLSGDN